MVSDGAGKPRKYRRCAYDKYHLMAIVRPLVGNGILDLDAKSAVKCAMQELSHYVRPGADQEDRMKLAEQTGNDLRKEVAVDDTHSVLFAQV